MPQGNGARTSSMTDLNLARKASTDTPGLEYVKDNPALLEKLCACEPTHIAMLMYL